MKVLFFTHWFPTEGNPQKGVFILEQAKALKKVGVDVVIIHAMIEEGASFVAYRVSNSEKAGIPVVTLDLTGWFWKIIYVFYPLQLFLIKRLIKKAKVDVASFDVFHSHVVHPAGALGSRLAEQYGLPHYVSEHWSNIAVYFKNNIFSSWGRKAYDNARKVFVVSNFLKRNTSQFVSDASKLEVVPNVVSSEEFKFKPVAIGTSYYMVMAAKWSKGNRVIKRPKLLIKAVAEASKELDKPIILGIIGDGDRIPELKKFCLQNDVHAQFHGFISKEQIAKEFQKADLFLHGSEYETFSVVIAEALKCGTPVVASNVCAIPELISDSNGLLVENKLTPWKDAIVKAMKTSYDKQVIADGFKTKFGYKEVGEKLLSSYQDKD